MVKFGLVVFLSQGPESHMKPLYVLPSMLPSENIQSITFTTSKMCLFYFSLYEENYLYRDSPGDCSLNDQVLHKLGFLPIGIYERIVGKAITWCKQTAPAFLFNARSLTKYEAILFFGNQQFRITCFPHINAIGVEISGSNPIVVYNRIETMIQSTIAENMKSLKYFTLLPSTQYVDESYISMSNLKHIVNSNITIHSNNKQITSLELKNDFSMWISNYSVLPFYDVFISHRWGNRDDTVVFAIFDRLTNYNVGREHRAINAFVDARRLKKGRDFVSAFCKALISSSVVAIIFSEDAMKRMFEHDSTQIDYVLLEWLLSIACINASGSKVKRIYPMLLGPNDDTGLLKSISRMDQISTAIPASTIAAANDILTQHNITPRIDINVLTVKAIVTSIRNYMGYDTSGVKFSDIVEPYTNDIHKLLLEIIDSESEVTNQTNESKSNDVVNVIAPASATVETKSPLQSAYDIITTAANVKDDKIGDMVKLLNDLGIQSYEDLADISVSEINQILEYLKPIKGRQFARHINKT
jgi:predicted flap endonuclease-1-like 5' DNA nuclease